MESQLKAVRDLIIWKTIIVDECVCHLGFTGMHAKHVSMFSA